MINRYHGNSGRVERYPDFEEKPVSPRPAPPPRPVTGRADPLQGFESITRLLPDKLAELETEDFILLLILYLMYRKSGDSELLIIMGAMFLL